MARYLDKYTGILKSLKPVHFIYNFLNRDKLKHNHSLYQKFGLRKSIYESIGSHDFGKHNPDIPWIDRPDALQNILQDVDYQRFTKEIQEQITHFVENGYLILRGWLPSEKVDIVNEEVNKLLQSKEADFNFSGKKIMMAHELSPVIDATFRQAELLEILNFLLGRKVIPFQTINFIEGSEQRPIDEQPERGHQRKHRDDRTERHFGDHHCGSKDSTNEGGAAQHQRTFHAKRPHFAFRQARSFLRM